MASPRRRNGKRKVKQLKADIRDAFFAALASSPVLPLGDGRWCPTCPPWVESRGPLALHIDGSAWHTHGSMVTRDSLLGPLYLVYQEILEPPELPVSFLLDFHSELMTDRNVVFSQPYYSRHPWIHLMRGETKAFLKAYYNTMASLADRETYTFWEHYFRASAHKTHEEAWFLMETRWMLYLERGQDPGLAGRHSSKLYGGRKADRADESGQLLWAAFVDRAIQYRTGTYRRRGGLRFRLAAGACRVARPSPGWNQGEDRSRVASTIPETERVIVEPFRGHAEVKLHY